MDMRKKKSGPYEICGADWRSGKRRRLRTKGSLVRDLTSAHFVVTLSKSHLPTA